MFYLILFLLITVLGLLDISKKNVVLRNEFSFLIIFILFFIAAFRYETGMDWKRYEEIYNSLPKFNSLNNLTKIFGSFDFGYNLTCITIKTFGGDIQAVFFFMQLMGTMFLWKTLKLYTDKKITSLLIYFSLLYFLLDLNLMRQMLATNIFFYSIHFINEKKLTKYIIAIIVAFSFHWSAIILFPLYILLKSRISTNTLIIIVVFFIIFFILQIRTGKLLYSLSSFIFGDSDLTHRVSYYTTSKIYSINRTLSLGFFINIIIFGFTIFHRNKLEKVVPFFNYFLNLMILQLFFYLVLYEYIEISGRLRFYTLISYVIIIPYFIEIFNFKINRLTAYFTIVLYCLSYSYIYMYSNKDTIAYNPYQNYIHYKLFNKQSTGNERLKKYLINFEKERQNAKKGQK